MSPRRVGWGAAIGSVVATVWLIIGLVGATSYVQHYVRYRGFAPAHDAPGVATGRVDRVRFYSPGVHAWKYYLIYRPPGYDSDVRRGMRFPVLYLLHGGPSIPEDFVRIGAVPVTYDTELAAHQAAPMLIVMPYGRVHSGPPDTEWANTSAGRYEDLVLDTVRAVDRSWPTRPDRDHRMLAGFSTGGYAAANITLHHPSEFASFESWSGFFIEDRAAAFKHEPQWVLDYNSPALQVRKLASTLRRYPVTGSLYQGNQDHEKTNMVLFAQRAKSAGANISYSILFGRHDWRIWRYRMKYELRYASRILTPPCCKTLK